MTTDDSHKTTRILYVEDDEGLAVLLQKRLGRLGYAVDTARTGEEILEMMMPGHYQAILLDYTLPGMNGMEVLRRIAPVNGEPPVIMLTAGGNEALVLEALHLGAEDYIVKDVNQTYMDLVPHVINAALMKLDLRRQNSIQQKELHFYVEELKRRNEELTEEIRERKMLEMELRDAKDKAEAANIAKSEFLANMSHEIRTPMNAVVGISNILASCDPLTPRQMEFVKTLQFSADSLLALINDLLDISRIESRAVELENIPFDLSRTMREASNIISVRAKEKGLGFTVDDEHVRGRVYRGDPGRLRQILLNLCSNAVKFTETGFVTLSSRVETAEGMETVVVSVSDTGIGIPPEKMGMIFDKFVQADSSINRKYGGTGLGLAITKNLVEIMDGTISVDSMPGEGSVFTLRLPLQKA